jgi:NitT/TauT family transport system substrate-binding protein
MLFLSLAVSPTVAQNRVKITLAYAANDSYAGAMVAKDKGLFERHGLDVELQFVALNSSMPAGLRTDTFQIAGTTTPTFLQAIDSGLDLVAISGGNVAEKTNKRYVAVARDGVVIAKPQDFIGKTVGVPSIGASTHVLFSNWLLAKNVPLPAVTFVAIPFREMEDTLEAGTVDVVLVSDPVLYNILKDGIGSIVATYMEVLPVQIPIIVYSTTREWASRHRSLIAAFRDAIGEANAMIGANPDVARDAEMHYLDLPPDVIANAPVPRYRAPITDAMLQNWVDIMNRQQLLIRKLDVWRLVIR